MAACCCSPRWLFADSAYQGPIFADGQPVSSAARYSGRYGSAGLTSSRVTGEHGKAERDAGPLEFRRASMLSTNLNGPESLHWN
jgi:hypothetical protein